MKTMLKRWQQDLLEKQVTELYQTLRKDLKIKAAIFYTAAGLGLSVRRVEKILGFK